MNFSILIFRGDWYFCNLLFFLQNCAMASASDVEIIIDPDRCTRIVDQLSKYDFIAMDAEGVNLGKEGPLTLLQIGTVDDKVYLFDIESNKDLFRKGHLEDLLQSEETVKVKNNSRNLFSFVTLTSMEYGKEVIWCIYSTLQPDIKVRLSESKD